MFNVCPNCGEYDVDKIIVPEGPYAVCPRCEYQHKFLRLPLFVLTGASGVGKTATCLALAAKAQDFVVMESDILWRDEFNQPETNYRDYRETWLRVCKNISQAGKSVILCGAAVPAQFEQCVERRYFSDIHYLALVCEDEVLAARKLYGGSINQFTHAFKSFGWKVVWADTDDLATFEAAISPRFNHVMLVVSNLDSSIAFYTTAFDLQIGHLADRDVLLG